MRILDRFVSLLLLPFLVADPATCLVLTSVHAPASCRHTVSQRLFSEQALELPVVEVQESYSNAGWKTQRMTAAIMEIERDIPIKLTLRRVGIFTDSRLARLSEIDLVNLGFINADRDVIRNTLKRHGYDLSSTQYYLSFEIGKAIPGVGDINLLRLAGVNTIDELGRFLSEHDSYILGRFRQHLRGWGHTKPEMPKIISDRIRRRFRMYLVAHPDEDLYDEGGSERHTQPVTTSPVPISLTDYLQPGSRVSHEVFGRGSLALRSGNGVVVKFDSGKEMAFSLLSARLYPEKGAPDTRQPPPPLSPAGIAMYMPLIVQAFAQNPKVSPGQLEAVFRSQGHTISASQIGKIIRTQNIQRPEVAPAPRPTKASPSPKPINPFPAEEDIKPDSLKRPPVIKQSPPIRVKQPPAETLTPEIVVSQLDTLIFSGVRLQIKILKKKSKLWKALMDFKIYETYPLEYTEFNGMLAALFGYAVSDPAIAIERRVEISKQIKDRYRFLLHLYHPDRNPKDPILAGWKMDLVKGNYKLLENTLVWLKDEAPEPASPVRRGWKMPVTGLLPASETQLKPILPTAPKPGNRVLDRITISVEIQKASDKSPIERNFQFVRTLIWKLVFIKAIEDEVAVVAGLLGTDLPDAVVRGQIRRTLPKLYSGS